MSLTVKVEGRDWLESAQPAWTELVRNSRANPLFLGWEWQHRWWVHFGPLLDARLALVTVRHANGALVGIAPFFTRTSAARRLRPARQIAPIGSVWRMNIGEVTEHLDWIARAGSETDVARAIGDYLVTEMQWDELLFSYTAPDSVSAVELAAVAQRVGAYVRRERPLDHYSVDTMRTFEEFVHDLGKRTRERIYARRDLLRRLGAVRRVQATDENITQQLEKLEQLSKKRWGAGLEASTRAFYLDVASVLLRAGKLRFSTLEVDGRPISALFDVDAGGVTYTIRSAIDTTFHRRLSPGLLHLGYAIEDACARADIHSYALLAGHGKRTDFKRDIARVSGSFTSFQILRRPHEKLLYRTYDRLTRPG
jgi:CelD/BcsL family acetyltransferase involved in cellulose biosynthesis